MHERLGSTRCSVLRGRYARTWRLFGTLCWNLRSNGQTEGQINKLKTLKRAMYGRAGVDSGVVTRTKFGRVKIGSLSSGSGRGGGSPRPERFVSEDAERAAGCEMALDVERVLDGGVNRQESLG